MAPLATIRAHIRERGSTLLGRLAAFFALSLLLFVAIGGVSHHPRWQITTIQVFGATIVSPDDIRTFVTQSISGDYYFAYARDNSLIFPKQEIEKALLVKFPRVQTSVASKVDSHTISIVVTERKPYALWCGEGFNAESYELVNCWFTDNTGYIFDQSPIFSEGTYLEVYGPLESGTTDNPIAGKVSSARYVNADHLAQALRADVADTLRIILLPDGELEIVVRANASYPMLNKVTLKLKDEMVPTVIVKNLHAALKEEFPDGTPKTKKLKYIDLRFGNKIFFGFEN